MVEIQNFNSIYILFLLFPDTVQKYLNQHFKISDLMRFQKSEMKNRLHWTVYHTNSIVMDKVPIHSYTPCTYMFESIV